MMRPGPRLPPLLGVLALAGLGASFLPGAGWAVAAALVALLGVAIAEAHALSGIRFEVLRPHALAIGLGTSDVLELRLRSDARETLQVRLRQRLPALVSPAAFEQSGVLRPAETLGMDVPLRGESRGRAHAGALHLAATRWGFVERITAAGEATDLDVVPDLAAVARVHAQLNRWALRGLGSRASPRLGKGREFDRLRDYVPGDDRRDIAWKATARRGRFTVREHRVERTQHVLLCLDRGYRMGARVAGLTKLDHAISAALVLAYVASRMEDVVGAMSFAEDSENGPVFGRGGGHLRLVTAFASRAHVSRAHSDYSAMAAAVRAKARQRTLVVLFTALAESDHAELLASIRLLRPQHLPLVVALSDPALLAATQLLPETETQLMELLAAQDVLAARRRTIADLRRLGALVVETAAADAGIAAMNAYIDVKRRQAL